MKKTLRGSFRSRFQRFIWALFFLFICLLLVITFTGNAYFEDQYGQLLLISEEGFEDLLIGIGVIGLLVILLAPKIVHFCHRKSVRNVRANATHQK